MHVRHRKLLAPAVIGIVGLLLCSCSSTPNVYSKVDKSADFSSYRSYSFFEDLATNSGNYESLESTYLKVAVSQQMDKRGFKYDPGNPVLLVNFYIHTEEKIRSQSVPIMGYYRYRDPFYDPLVGYGGYETRVTQYSEGTLNIDVVVVRTNILVWEGATVGRITDKLLQNLEASVDAAVEEVFTQFPAVVVGG